MHANNLLHFPEPALKDTSKKSLIKMVLSLRSEIREKDLKIAELQKKLSEKEAELDKQTQSNINKTVNQPSSKQAEFNKDTGTHPKKKKSKKRRTGRKGAGNKPKLEPDVVNHNPPKPIINHRPSLNHFGGYTTHRSWGVKDVISSKKL